MDEKIHGEYDSIDPIRSNYVNNLTSNKSNSFKEICRILKKMEKEDDYF
ncbi:MAG TPA: hypothetical protein VLA74_07250 [Nitrososphaeraceae archaeon]|nr:hypothetical protein [Nitrososphaeraceae archaeon]